LSSDESEVETTPAPQKKRKSSGSTSMKSKSSPILTPKIWSDDEVQQEADELTCADVVVHISLHQSRKTTPKMTQSLVELNGITEFELQSLNISSRFEAAKKEIGDTIRRCSTFELVDHEKYPGACLFAHPEPQQEKNSSDPATMMDKKGAEPLKLTNRKLWQRALATLAYRERPDKPMEDDDKAEDESSEVDEALTEEGSIQLDQNQCSVAARDTQTLYLDVIAVVQKKPPSTTAATKPPKQP
jgi:hypothetical protein